MGDLPAFAQQYPMNLAETASTFAEMVVGDATLKLSKSKEEYLALLEGKIQNAVAFFMNIHARFLFDKAFYEARKKGPVGSDELNEMMLQAQKTAYSDALEVYHPYFWASKLHFYMTEVPMYNFPYTFGYLFSSGIYDMAADAGQAFEEKYISLLRDTGSMNAEELAKRHLGVDLAKQDFWQAAVNRAMADVEEFMKLTAKN
jgi:oligoendopeptidase F